MNDGTDRDSPACAHMISRKPPIFWGPTEDRFPAGPGSVLAEHFGTQRAYYLISPSWSLETARIVREFASIRELRVRFPSQHHIILCNTRGELDLCRRDNIPGILCSYLAFINETVFDIAPGAAKQFDAIYNALLRPFKRHELCRDIESLGLIYYFLAGDQSHRDRVQALLPGATFINETSGQYRSLPHAEVAAWLNRARVGLCLSAAEGAMRAAAEYLFCGIPVVTTPSKGGRDRLLNPMNSITVDPTPEAVADGVRRLIARRIKPKTIRDGVFNSLKPDRARLLKLIAMIHADEQTPFPHNADWVQVFRRGNWPLTSIDRLLNSTAVSETEALVRNAAEGKTA
jgi:hypothetical protein